MMPHGPHERPARHAALVSVGTGLAAGLVAAAWVGIGDAPGLLAWSLAGGGVTALLAVAGARLFLPADPVTPGHPVRLGLPNALTLARFALIAPTVGLIAAAQYAPAALFYAVLIATDVADGLVARARGQTSRFGVIMDPLADVASTFAVFSVFVVDNLVPRWLYLLLAARYAMLLLGSVLLTRLAGPIAYRATIPGKVVGVVQAAGALWIMSAATGAPWVPVPGGLLFAILGAGFAAIVVSQARIGARHVRRAAAPPGGWQGGSSR
jgi:cardiolipin synthase